MTTWRTNPFVQGRRYRIVKTITGSIDTFEAGDVLEFVDSAYSRYDGSSAFTFRDEKSGERKTWTIRDDDGDEGFDVFAAEK